MDLTITMMDVRKVSSFEDLFQADTTPRGSDIASVITNPMNTRIRDLIK